MNTKTLILAAAATLAAPLVFASAATTVAQNAQDETWNEKSWATLAHVIGCDVRLQATPEQLREAAEDNNEPDRDKGEVTNLLFDPQSGEIEWAVISCGGLLGIGDHTVAVPASRLQWNGEQRAFDIDATKADLEGAPEFDLSIVKREGLESSFDVVEAAWSREVVEAPRAEQDPEEKAGEVMVFDQLELRRVPHRFAIASELDEYPVFARAEKFGGVQESIVDLSNMRIAYTVISHGGLAGIGDEHYLLPYQALNMCEKTEDDERVLCVDRSMEEMMQGVKYEKPEKGVISPEAARRARANYDA